MNWPHLTAFVWLRYRLMANQWRRAGALSAAIMVVLSVMSVITVIPIFVGTFIAGVYLIPKAEPAYLMYAWDVLNVAFVLFWGIGLMMELQKSDALSLSKFLHLPVSANGAFLINYLSSLLRLSLLYFVPAMAAYALALVYVKGVQQLLVLPSLVAFLFLITASSYQFQGWLASMMSNPRRRRTIVVAMTMGFVLIFQVPNFINLYAAPRRAERQSAHLAAKAKELQKLQQAFEAKKIDNNELTEQSAAVYLRYTAQATRDSQQDSETLKRVVRLANLILPVGWLPIGVMSAAEGWFLPAVLGLVGMTSIGSFCLWRAYRTTIAQFQGQSSNRKGRAPAARLVGETKPGGRWLETRIPWMSEPVSAIALGTFQSLLRSPEAKITLLTPLIMGGVFGSMLLQTGSKIPESIRPFLGIAAIAFVLFGLLQAMGNQFGMDRDGFRVFVLCAAPRRDILLGKNLAYVPPAFLISTILVMAAMVLSPMRIDHAVSMLPQFVSMFLMFCAMANLFSILAPVFINAGTLKPANPKMSTVLLQLLMFLILFPICQGLTLLPLAVEAGLRTYGVADRVPICLLLSLVECVAIFFFYRASLGWLGALLQSREQKIVETVTNRAM